MKAIRYILYLTITFFILLASCAEDPKMPDNLIGAEKPVVITLQEVEDLKAREVTVFGKIEKENGSPVNERGFIYYIEGNNIPEDSIPTLNDKDDKYNFKQTLKGLKDSTNYQVKAYARNSIGISYGQLLEFKTISGLVRVSTLPVTEIKATSAKLKANITYPGEGDIIERGFYYSKNPFSSTSSQKDSIVSTQISNDFFAEVAGLDKLQKYYVRAYVKNLSGTATGNQIEFSTTDGRPKIADFETIEITAKYVELKANVIAMGDSEVLVRGFCYSDLSETPNINNDTIHCGAGEGIYIGRLKELSPQKSYYVSAFAENSMGVTYSEKIEEVVLLSDLATVVTNQAYIDENDEGGIIRAGGRIVNKGTGSIVAAGIVWDTKPDPTIDLGGNRVDLWNGQDEFSGKISGLKGGIIYYFRAFVDNGNGISYGESVTQKGKDIFTSMGAIFTGDLRVPSSAYYMSIDERNNKQGYLLGGVGESLPTDQLWSFNASTLSWDPKASMPEKRSHVSVGFTGTAFVVFGGLGEDGNPHDDVFHFYLGTEKWDRALPPQSEGPGPMYGGIAFDLDVMHIIGGVNKSNERGSIMQSVWTYEPILRNWNEKKAFPEPQYNGYAFTYYNSESRSTDIIAGLGLNSLETISSSNRLWKSTDRAESWRELPSMPGDARATAAILFNSYIYVVDSNSYIRRFNIMNEEWETKARIPINNWETHCLFTLNGNLYIGLGGNANQLIKYDHTWDN